MGPTAKLYIANEWCKWLTILTRYYWTLARSYIVVGVGTQGGGTVSRHLLISEIMWCQYMQVVPLSPHANTPHINFFRSTPPATSMPLVWLVCCMPYASQYGHWAKESDRNILLHAELSNNRRREACRAYWIGLDAGSHLSFVFAVSSCHRVQTCFSMVAAAASGMEMLFLRWLGVLLSVTFETQVRWWGVFWLRQDMN